MWKTLVFLLFFITLTSGETDVFDVTTIYDVGNLCTSQDKGHSLIGLDEVDNFQSSEEEAVNTQDELIAHKSCTAEIKGRIHSRTNALGLDLKSGRNDYFSKKKFQPVNITCEPYENICTWNMKDWALSSHTNSWTKMNLEESYFLTNDSFSIIFEQLNSDKSGLFFLPNKESINQNGRHFLFTFSRTETLYSTITGELYSNCESSYYHRTYQFIFSGSSIGCSAHHDSFTFQLHDRLDIYWKNWRVKVYNRETSSYLIDTTISSSYNNMPTYARMLSAKSDIIQPLLPSQAYTATVEGSEMISPMIVVDTRQLCMVLVFYTEEDSKDDLLHILAEDALHTRHNLIVINNVKAGWKSKLISKTLQSNVIMPIKLIVRKIGTLKVEIIHISSCNPDCEEVELLPSTSISSELEQAIKDRSQSSLSEYTVNLPLLKNKKTASNLTNYCLNGGVSTMSSCGCPPGFTGPLCQQSCGKNRFGQDCGGLCSLHTQGCQGLLMCTNSIGCLCGPGYTGYNCNQKCFFGTYGNDCLQKCGNCASGSPCDIYTGRCAKCERGYLPPYCQQEYVYLASKPEISSTDYGVITVSFNPKNVSGYGIPKLYKIQYREKNAEWLTSTIKSIQSSEHDELSLEDGYSISENIQGLKHGVHYEVQVLLLNTNLNMYSGERVQTANIVSKCDVPEKYDYKIQTVADTNSFTFSWSYTNETVYWCPVETFEVSWKEGWQWLSRFSQGNFSLSDFFPDSNIKFKVRAKTSGGFAPYSNTIEVSTHAKGSSAVENLTVVSSLSTSAEVSWQPPIDSNGRQLLYKISYECVAQLACSPGCVNAIDGELTQTETSVTLSHLLPFAEYIVSVTPENGLETTIYLGTTEVVPTEIPSESSQSPVRTNTSVTVFWDPVPVCSSFMLGYNYQLIKESESTNSKVLANGLTKETHATFHNLTASTDYVVKVFINTVAGWNHGSFLAINVSTSATVPEAVRNLTVYKRSRNMLGLRWSEPRATYGKLKSFTVKHELGQDVASHTIEPTKCVIWPDLYCHTIESLKSNRRYNITVSAKNIEVAEDGETISIIGVTKESSPLAPENLKLINGSSKSVTLQWNHPNMVNGLLRSFLINVEETEKYDQDSCCQVYPLIETPVKEEVQSYEVEVSGLHPASTYYVSVSAKTVGLGPSQSIVVYTRPPHMPFTVLPDLQVLDYLTLPEDLSWLPQENLPELNNSDIYTPLIKTRMVLTISNDTESLPEAAVSGIQDSEISSLLNSVIKRPYQFVAEFNQDGSIIEDSTTSSSPLNDGEDYQLIAAQVTEYNGVYNVDLRYSSTFTYP